MTIDEAYRRIEATYGFDDTTTMVGEAWDLVKHEIATLQSQLAASQERERILRKGLEKYADHHYWDARTSIYNDYWKPISNGYDIAERTLKAAEEVKGCTGK